MCTEIRYGKETEMKSDIQIAAETLEKCKKHLENEEKMMKEYLSASEKWTESIDLGEEDEQLGIKVDEIYEELLKEREEFRLYARILVRHLSKLEIL